MLPLLCRKYFQKNFQKNEKKLLTFVQWSGII